MTMKKKFALESKLVLAIIGVSSLVTTLLTSVAIVVDYRSELARQRQIAQNLQLNIAGPLGSLLYNGDEDLITIYAQSVLANREVACIEIEDFYSKLKKKIWCDNDTPVLESFDVSSPIYFEGFNQDTSSADMQNLGTVRLQFSDKFIVEGIKERILTFFGSQALKTLIVSLLILFMIRFMVMRHIQDIFRYFREYESKFKGKQLRLLGKKLPHEFEELVRSINVMVGRQEQIINVAAEREHYYKQLAKVFYPHQLDRIGAGDQLEMTMPVGRGEAVVIAFDLVGSSQVQSAKFENFIRALISSCNEVMMRDYDPIRLTSGAYRIKVMGDGFLCSVGYPLRTKDGKRPEDVAVEMAEVFARRTQELTMSLGLEERVLCGIGIAMGEIESFFPETIPAEYDIFGRALIHATRYESCRRVLFEEFQRSDSIITMQAGVYQGLSPDLQKLFTRYDLKSWSVRDDPDAVCLYYRFIDSDSALVKAS